MTSTIAKFNQPILYSYTYKMPLPGAVNQHTIVGQLTPEQDSFAMEPGSKLTLGLPEVADAGQNWTVKTDAKAVQINDKGFTKSGNPDEMGGSGYHTFMLQCAGAAGATPVHFVLNQFGKAIAERTLNITTAEA